MNVKSIHNQVFDFISTLFPGLDRLVLLYQSDNDDEIIEGNELIKSGTSYKNRTLSMNASINQLMPKGNNIEYKWLHNSELPFEQSDKSYSPTLFSEYEHLVLNIIITNVNSGLIELYYLFFRDDLSNFGINSNSKLLDSNQKMIIGKFLSKFITYLYNSFSINLKKQSEFTKVTKKIVENVNNELSLENSWFKDWTIDLLKELPTQPVGEWIVDNDLLSKIKSIGDFSLSKQLVLEAGRFASMLYSNDENWPVLASFIVDDDVKSAPKVESKAVVNDVIESDKPLSRMERVELWLDSVEAAAEELVNDGEEATGAAVGALLNPPVSAPAITDWLRKNQSRVTLALERYNEKWPIIRSYFRPLINAVNREMVEKTG